VRQIPFPETRAYVENVIERRREYAENYADDLGL
jgi:soluble lytic murein transglycosylase-like protein